ncbi:serine hydrolase domain-containing protein [Candidiatus Paracoxiella cheracis]|uniref:serine hydrolase domain-containing protein n=1 Tax=Candidiatus Paracoxiella cheracis TaxID=3405120 RepID=UPI003BF57EF0
MKAIDTVKYNLPGAILSVCEPGNKIRHYCSGAGDIKENKTFDPNMLFQTGRITRMFTAAIVWKLVESGVLDLDMPMDSLAHKHRLDSGRLQLIVNQYSYLKPLTLRELLNQTSGLPSYDQTARYQRMFFEKPKKVWQAEGYLDLITGNEVRYRLGYELPIRGIYSESTTNFIILTLVLEAATGQHVSQQMRLFFDSFGLNNTHYSSHGVLDEQLLPKLAHGYMPISHPWAEAFRHLPILTFNDNRELQVYDITNAYNFNGLAGSASISTTTDLIHWMKALVNGKVLVSTFREMFKVVPVLSYGSSYEDQDFYGLGIHKTLSKRYGEIIWNAGNNFGYGALIAYSVDRDIAFALAVNVSRYMINIHSEGIVADVLAELLH